MCFKAVNSFYCKYSIVFYGIIDNFSRLVLLIFANLESKKSYQLSLCSQTVINIISRRKIAILNFKSGTRKTITVVNLGYALSLKDKDYKVLIIPIIDAS